MFGNGALQCIRSFDDRSYLKANFSEKCSHVYNMLCVDETIHLNFTETLHHGQSDRDEKETRQLRESKRASIYDEKATCWNRSKKYCIHIESNAHRLNIHNILYIYLYSCGYVDSLLISIFPSNSFQTLKLTESKNSFLCKFFVFYFISMCALFSLSFSLCVWYLTRKNKIEKPFTIQFIVWQFQCFQWCSGCFL